METDLDEPLHTGVMVALWPSSPAKYAIGSEPVDQLHVTLGFLGEADDLSRGDRTTIDAATRAAANAADGPIEATVAGVDVFGDDDGGALVLLLDGPALPAVHDAVWSVLDEDEWPDQFVPWRPHMTVAYLDHVADQAAVRAAAEALVGETIEIAHVGPAIDGEQHRVPLWADVSRETSQFANPYHDELGRFARKREGRRVSTGRVASVLGGLARPDQMPHSDVDAVLANRDLVDANRATVIEQLGADGEALVAGVRAWTGAANQIETVRAGIASGDPTMTRFRDVVAAAPLNEVPLYRGMHYTDQAMFDALTSLKEGDVLPARHIASFSASRARAIARMGQTDEGVIVTITPGGAPALDVDSISNTREHEFLVAHDLRVKSVKHTRTWDEDEEAEMVLVELEVEAV